MTRDVAGGGYDGKEAQNFLLKEELEKNNSEGLIRAKLQPYIKFLSHFLRYSQSVHPRIYRNRHVGVRSTAVVKANISRESKVGNNVLEWCSHPMSGKKQKKL